MFVDKTVEKLYETSIVDCDDICVNDCDSTVVGNVLQGHRCKYRWHTK